MKSKKKQKPKKKWKTITWQELDEILIRNAVKSAKG